MTYLASFQNVQREYLGAVGVDSGQLVITDPANIESQWTKRQGSACIGIMFWGVGEERMANLLQDAGYKVEKHSAKDTYVIKTTDPAVQNCIVEFILDNRGKKHPNMSPNYVAYYDLRASTYDMISDLTLSEKKAGVLNYKLGHTGMAVAFAPGVGDGLYEVHATYADLGKMGRRIVKVEMDFVRELESI